jgi:dipeptidyl aminopeptidase/acylaminoacyl peptidase
MAPSSVAIDSEAEAPPELIPVELLLGHPRRAKPLLSPDGRSLAYLDPDQRGVMQVWLRTLSSGEERMLTRDPHRGIFNFQWAESGEQVLFLQDRDGDENWHVHSVDLAGRCIRDLTPFQGVRAQEILLDPKFPHRMLVGLNLRDDRLFDLYNVDLRTGALELHTENPGDVVHWVADAELCVRAALAVIPEGGMEVRVRDDESSAWRTALVFGDDDDHGTILGFTPDNAGLWLSSSVGSDTLRLVRLDLATGEQSVVAEDSGSDLAQTLIHPLTRVAQAAAFGTERVRWRVLDRSVERDFAALTALEPGDFTVQNRDHADRHWVVSYRADVAPLRHYLYDRDRGEATFLWSSWPELERHRLAPMRPVSMRARDGLELLSYLTVPLGREPRGLPLLILVHGGPWVRDTWGFLPDVQWLANRGYAVLQVNFRGSTGFGKRFLHAGDREWGAKMHDDLLDAVHWAVDEGIADPERMGIMGGSYGGYAALVGATFTPEVFCCAVDVVGPSNLVTLLNSFPSYWAPMRKMMERRVGSPATEREFLESRSPLFRADRIRIPMLIAHGANDPRVKQAESEQIIEAIRAAGKEVEYLLFEDEGHGFARPENRLRFFRHAERFLARHLGGRCEEG